MSRDESERPGPIRRGEAKRVRAQALAQWLISMCGVVWTVKRGWNLEEQKYLLSVTSTTFKYYTGLIEKSKGSAHDTREV